MKKYTDFNEFMAALTRLAKRQVNHYYTDFTDYDIPRLEKLNAAFVLSISSKRKSKKILSWFPTFATAILFIILAIYTPPFYPLQIS